MNNLMQPLLFEKLLNGCDSLFFIRQAGMRAMPEPSFLEPAPPPCSLLFLRVRFISRPLPVMSWRSEKSSAVTLPADESVLRSDRDHSCHPGRRCCCHLYQMLLTYARTAALADSERGTGCTPCFYETHITIHPAIPSCVADLFPYCCLFRYTGGVPPSTSERSKCCRSTSPSGLPSSFTITSRLIWLVSIR